MQKSKLFRRHIICQASSWNFVLASDSPGYSFQRSVCICPLLIQEAWIQSVTSLKVLSQPLKLTHQHNPHFWCCQVTVFHTALLYLLHSTDQQLKHFIICLCACLAIEIPHLWNLIQDVSCLVYCWISSL